MKKLLMLIVLGWACLCNAELRIGKLSFNTRNAFTTNIAEYGATVSCNSSGHTIRFSRDVEIPGGSGGYAIYCNDYLRSVQIELPVGVDVVFSGSPDAVVTSGSLTIVGPGSVLATGSVTSSHEVKLDCAVAANITIESGCCIYTGDDLVLSGALLTCTVRERTSNVVECHNNVRISASMVNLTSGVDGSSSSDALFASGDIDIIASVLSVCSCGDGVRAVGNVRFNYVAASIVSTGPCVESKAGMDAYKSVSFSHVNLNAVSRSGPTIFVGGFYDGWDEDERTTEHMINWSGVPVRINFGEGNYMLSSPSHRAAVYCDSGSPGIVKLSNADVKCCAPGGDAIFAYGFIMDGGTLRPVKDVDFSSDVEAVLGEAAVESLLAAAGTFGSWTGTHAAFLTLMCDQMIGLLVRADEGWPKTMVHSRRFLQSGGEVIQGAATYGYLSDTDAYINEGDPGSDVSRYVYEVPALTGGAFNGYFYGHGYDRAKSVEFYGYVSPTNSLGQVLTHVDYSPYWEYRGTPANTDLSPCTPPGWSGPLVVSKKANDLVGTTQFTCEDDIYVSFAVLNVGADLVTPFIVSIYIDGMFFGYKECVALQNNYYMGWPGLSIGKVGVGNHRMVMSVDDLNEVMETNENNNFYFVDFSVVDNRATVSLNPQGGEVSPETIMVFKESAIGTLPTPTRSKYKFLGWYTSAEGGTKVSSTTKVTADVTYYAHWTYDGSATVAVDVGSGCEGMGTVSGGKAAKGGTKVTLKATAKKGYVFAGWFRDAAGEEPVEGGTDYRSPSYAYVVGEEDATFYAKFVTVAEDVARLSVANIAAGETFVVDDSWTKKIEIDSYSIPSVSAKGLPAGLKFDAKTLTISGKPTKPGKYDVELSLKNASVKTAKKFIFKIVVPNLESDLIADGIDYASDAYAFVAGTKIAPILPVLAEGVTVKATGLPSGLKLVGGKNGVPYSIEGTSTAKPGAYTVTLTLTKGTAKETATITVNIENRKLDLMMATCDGSLTNGCKVTGGGSYAAGKKVTLKATAAKGAVFAGWYRDSGCTEALEGSVDYRTASYSYVTTDRDEAIYAKFVPAADDTSIDLGINGKTAVDDSGAVRVVVKDAATLPSVVIGSVSIPKASVKGLPTGMKWDAKKNCFTGAPTKPGIYKVAFSLTNTTVKKAIVRAFTIEVPNFESPAFPGLKPETDAYPVSVGVAALPSVDAGLASAYAGYAVKVTGLPSGLTWKGGVLTGLAKKAGDYTVTFTATKGKDKQVSTITIHVEALSDWAVGTFVGMVRQVDRDERGEIIEDEDGLHDWYDILTTVSVTSAGKVSGKLHFESDTDVSLKSDSISERTDAGYVVRGQLMARGIASDVELRLRKIGMETTGVGDLGAVDVLMRQTARQDGSNWIECNETTFSTDEDAPLRQNVWSSKKLPLPPSVIGVKKTVTVEDNIYTLTFGKNGSVKVSLAKADKPTKAIASGSATLSIVGHASEVWHCELCTSVVVKKNDYGAVCIFDVTILEDGTVTCVPQK